MWPGEGMQLTGRAVRLPGPLLESEGHLHPVHLQGGWNKQAFSSFKSEECVKDEPGTRKEWPLTVPLAHPTGLPQPQPCLLGFVNSQD